MNMILTSQFLSAFFEPDEPLHLRAFKPRNAGETAGNRPLMVDTTLAALTSSPELQHKLKTANQEMGVYFCPNPGGSTDAEVTRFTSWFVESDSLSIVKQHERLDHAPISPCVRVETRKSVHAYWLVQGDCSTEEWRDIQLRLIAYFDGDPKIVNPSRVLRVPGFFHLHQNGGGLEKKKVEVHTFAPSRRYSAEQMRNAYPEPENVLEGQQWPTTTAFEFHELRHEELCQRIMSRGKRNAKNNYDARGTCHNGKGGKGLVFFPSSRAVRCNNEPACDYFSILRAEGLPDEHLPSREKTIAEPCSPSKNDSEANLQRDFEPQNDSGLKIVCMATVEPEDVRWLWNPYIALGKLTLVEGDPGVGKSWITAALAAAVSRGRGLAGMELTEPANVLMLSVEDGLADTLRPRLDAVGADVERVLALNEPLVFDGPGLLRLEVAITEHKPILVTVDPLFGFVGRVDINSANQCRTITARLAAIAEQHACAIIAIRHLGKSRGMGHALNAGVGSIDLTAAARSVLLAGKDPDDENKRAIVQIKSNLAPHGPAVGFTLRGGEFFWTGASDLTDARILSYAPSESERPALDEATEFLRDELSAGDCDVATLKANARRAGIQEITLRRGKERLGVKVKRQGFGKGGKWTWELPIDAQAASIDAQKIDDEHLWTNRDDKSTYSNDLTIDAHGNNYEHLQGGLEHLQGGLGHDYVEPSLEEWRLASADPQRWARMLAEAELHEIEESAA
jgi:hypothetical protein